MEGAVEKPQFDPIYYGRQVLNLGKRLYSLTSPRFGCSDYNAAELAPSDEEIASFHVFDSIGGVYWANFFSPTYVDRIGRKCLEKPPIGWSEALSDGGMLYIIAHTFFDDDASEFQRRRMKEYFGL